ncbi:MAG: 16S rRNA (guanine(527)-N(7))-methyltransferase RsmG [Cyanobacteria bacterium REEB417]|nr:16S rRNA (guanine(527)-N(7))-methyltransferase RsmG [Cyanobacteria bacterium REEB417]
MSVGEPTALWKLLGWQPSELQLGQFQQLQDELRSWNARLNLTRLVEGDDFWIAQVFDSLWPLVSLLKAAPPVHMIDVGTGGGFPGLALAIALPQARLTLVDSVQRKIEAVRAMATTLGLAQRMEFCGERAEKLGQDPAWRQRFDWAMARAVAPAPVVAEYLVPLLRPGGRALLYRGQWSPPDREQLNRATRSLNARVEAVEALDLPAGRGLRHAVSLVPVAGCPHQYPRAVGIPAKQPLGG